MNSASLSQVLLNPPKQLSQKGGAAEPPAKSDSFAKYLQKKADQQSAHQNQLGTSKRAVSEKDQAAAEQDRDAKKIKSNQNAAAFLLMILNQMKQMARDGADTNGAFTLQGINQKQFEALLKAMGLGADEAGSFSQFLTQNDSPLRLDDFLTMLASHLEKLTKADPITVQETDLPFIQSLLDRLGVSAGQINSATDPAVTGDNQLDLNKLVAGLKDLEKTMQQGNQASAALSQWDLEQLRNLISEAGLTDENQQAMLRSLLQKSGALEAADPNELTAFLQQKIDAGQLPVPFTAEQLAALQHDKLAAILDKYGLAGELPSSLSVGQSVSMTLDQLTSFLDRVATLAQGRQPKIDLASFAEKLDQIFQNVKPGGEQPVWTPLMQDSMQKVYDKLQQLVDFSNVSISTKERADLRLQYLTERADLNDAAQAKAATASLAASAGSGEDTGTGAGTTEEQNILNTILGAENKPADPDATDPALSLNAARSENLQPSDMGPVAQLPQQPARPSLGIMEQQLFDQISKGVLRGVQNGEHHLVLKLHPPELGEVKVELMVHHDQVSVSFSMDNSKVKQAMENNMQQFRDNLAQRGFVLQNCFVSVGNGNEQNDTWRRFEQAMEAGKVQTVRQADLPVEILYQRSAGQHLTDGGISVFI